MMDKDRDTINIGVTKTDEGAKKSGLTDQESVILPRKYYLSFIRHMFKNVGRKEYLYNDNESISKIIINDSSAVDVRSLNTKPAITIGRAPMSYSNLFIGDRAFFGQKGGLVSGMSLGSGADLMTGAFIVNCYSRNAYEAELLGWMVISTTKVFQKDLCRQILHHVTAMTISPPMEVGSMSEFKYVSVSVNFAIENEWISNKFIENMFSGCVKFDFEYTPSVGDGEDC